MAGGLGRAKILLGFLVSGLCVAALLWNVDWPRLGDAIGGADYGWLALAMVALLVEFWLRVLRWQMLLAPAKRVSRRSLFLTMSVGYMANGVLPGRLGELVRVFLLARTEAISPVVVLSTVAVDRILDVVVVTVALAVVLPTAQLPAWVGSTGAMLGAGGLLMLALSTFLAYPSGRRTLERLIASLPTFPGKSAAVLWLESLCRGLEGLSGVGSLMRILGASLLVWLASMAMFYCGLVAFHVQSPPASAMMVAAMTSLGAVVPSSPGYVGVFHYLVVLALQAYGVEREVALAYAVVTHLVLIVPLGLLGAFSLSRLGLSPRSLGRVQGDDDLRFSLRNSYHSADNSSGAVDATDVS